MSTPDDAAGPEDAGAKVRKERDETDASLREERTKTDAELARTRRAVEGEADHVVEVARDVAEATLRTARERADRRLSVSGAAPEVRAVVEVERASEDRAVDDERSVADAQLRREREARRREVAELLSQEREATDEGLLVERARADEVVATRDDFLAIVSHDLRNMLSGITTSAAMLKEHATAQRDGGSVVVKYAERIKRFTGQMNRLVDDLLDVVSLEAGRLHVAPRADDAVQLARDAAEAFQPSFAARGIALTTEFAEASILAPLDHERIFQVLANLLGNALKFTEPGGEVALRVARAGGDVRFSVLDTGVGVPAELRTAVFERFRQVGVNDRRGLGLGLYIAKSIVEAHGGAIWADAREPRGTAFQFMLPAAGPA